MQKIADAADEFMEKVAVPRVNNSEIAKLVRTKYRTLNLKVLGDFLDKANVLKFEALATGLFSAAGLRGEMARESGYGNVWVRDNVFVAHALVLAGREPQANAAVSALARFFCNHSTRFTDIIEGAVDPSDVRLRPNVRLAGC